MIAARKKTTNEKGLGASWRKLRHAILSVAPICERHGCNDWATTVDHITPRALGGLNDPENLRALCDACHAEISNNFRNNGINATPPKSDDEMQFVVLRGIPGSGKSTVAETLKRTRGAIVLEQREFAVEIAEKYDLPLMNTEVQKLAKEQVEYTAAWECEHAAKLIVIDAVHVSLSSFAWVAELAQVEGYSVSVVEPESPWWLDGSRYLGTRGVGAVRLAEACRSSGTHDVPMEDMIRMIEQWQVPPARKAKA